VPIVGILSTGIETATLMVVFLQEGVIDLIIPPSSPGLFG